MPRPKKEKPNRSDGRFEVKITTGKTFEGKLIRKSFYSEISKADAQRQAEEYKINSRVSEITGRAPEDEHNITFCEWAERYIEIYKRPNVTDDTYRQELSRYKMYIKPYFKNAYLTDVRSADIAALFGTSEVRKKSSSVQVKIKNLLFGIFDMALDNELVFKNPVRKIDLGKYKKVHEKSVYDSKQIKTAVEYCLDHPSCALLGILIKTGMRRGELLALDFDDIDLDKKVIYISKSYRDGAKIAPPKTEAGNREIPIDNDTVKLLSEINRNIDYIKGRKTHIAEVCPYVVHSFRGLRITPSNWYKRDYKKMMDELSTACGIPALTPHELRHTCGTELYRSGVDLRTIQHVMGHATLEITSGLYIHTDLDTMRKMMKLDDDIGA